MHNTIYVPGHFHGTVVAGTTLAFMAMTYLVVPLIFQRDIVWRGWRGGSRSCSGSGRRASRSS